MNRSQHMGYFPDFLDDSGADHNIMGNLLLPGIKFFETWKFIIYLRKTSYGRGRLDNIFTGISDNCFEVKVSFSPYKKNRKTSQNIQLFLVVPTYRTFPDVYRVM